MAYIKQVPTCSSLTSLSHLTDYCYTVAFSFCKIILFLCLVKDLYAQTWMIN